MTETAAAAGGVDNPSRDPLRSLGVFAITTILGPIIGALVVAGPFAVFADKPFQSVQDFVSALWGLAIVGYAAGLSRAVVVGAWLAFLTWRHGTFGYGQSVLTALGVTLLGTLYAFAAVGIAHPVAVLSVNAIMGLASVAAVLVCRWIAGRLGLATG